MTITIATSRRVAALALPVVLLTQGCVNQTYIRVATPLQPVETAEAVTSLPASDLAQTIEYFDGLGKRAQLVEAHASPSGKDRVIPIAYDDVGIQNRTYLPYVSGSNSGFYQGNALADQANFHRNAAGIAHTDRAFSEQILQRSPLRRVVEESPPGDQWLPGSGHSIRMAVRTNSSGEVRRWRFDSGYTYVAQAPPRFHSDSFYAAGSLQVTERQDENGRRLQTFTDSNDRVVLKRGFVAAGAGENAIDTCYFYDDFGNLHLILPPMAVQEMQAANSWIVNTGIIGRWATEYRYDYHHRRVETRVPGKAPSYVVYDKLDRPVLTQDGELRRFNRWRFTKFDRLGRQVLTGIYHDSQHLTRESMQAYADTYADNVQTLFFERRQQAGGSSFAMEIDYFQGYSDRAFPPTPQATVLSVTYYDDYDFNNNGDRTDDYSYVANAAFPDNKPSERVQGRMTGQKFKILAPTGSTLPKWSTTAYFYDDYGRVIQTYQRNHRGISITDTQYSFAGRVLRENTLHTGTDGVIVRKRYGYDAGGRLLRAHQQNNNDPEVLLAEQEYDELGRLRARRLHSQDQGSTFLQQVDYHYNARGWLTAINSPWLVGTTPSGQANAAPDLFGMELLHERTDSQFGNTPQYNGNVSLATWRTLPPGTGVSERPVLAYSYEYDGLDQLTAAHFRAFDVAGQPAPANDRYTMFASYDLNGNFTHQLRMGATAVGSDGVASGYGPIDDLSYTLAGNRLLAVDDAIAANHDHGFADRGARYDGVVPEYAYDANGNMVRDANKGADIRYNVLNLPEEVDFGGGDAIRWIYDAAGTRLRESVIEDGALVKTFDWVGGIVYHDDAIGYFVTPHGRVSRTDSGALRYEYYLIDHVGNMRVSFAAAPDGRTPVLLQEHDYYPFGLTLRGLFAASASTEDRTGYGGKEIEDAHGLNWYHYGARYYDPELGRWHVMDPDDQYHSPYAFSANNPVRFVDPTGRSVEDGIPDDLQSGEQIILDWLLEEDFPTSNWGKLLSPNGVYESLYGEHASKVMFTVNWFILKAIEEKKADATLYDILFNAWSQLTSVRKGIRLLGGTTLPSSSESIILRDAQRYLWGRVGVPRVSRAMGVPDLAIFYAAYPVNAFYELMKFLGFLTYADGFVRSDADKPNAAVGGGEWFERGKWEWFIEDAGKLDTQIDPVLLKVPLLKDLSKLPAPGD